MPADPAIEAAARALCSAISGRDPDAMSCGRPEWQAWVPAAELCNATWLEAKAAEIFVPANEAEKHILPWLRTSAQALREGERE